MGNDHLQEKHCDFCSIGSKEICVYHLPDFKYRFWLQDFQVGQDFIHYILRYNTIMFLLSGRVELTVNDKNFILKAGEMVVIPMFSVVTTKVLDSVKVVSLTLLPDFFHLCLSHSLPDTTKVPGPPEILNFTPIVSCFLDNLLFYLEHVPCCQQMHCNKTYELGMLLSLSYKPKELTDFLQSLFCKDHDFVYKINMNLDYFVSVENMAERMNMSVSAFSNTFKNVFKASPYKWLLKQKAHVILQYISVHDCTVKDISDLFNFNSPSHFHRFCVSQYDCSPVELFRKMKRPKKFQ